MVQGVYRHGFNIPTIAELAEVDIEVKQNKNSGCFWLLNQLCTQGHFWLSFWTLNNTSVYRHGFNIPTIAELAEVDILLL